jgi:hypothetical protein
MVVLDDFGGSAAVLGTELVRQLYCDPDKNPEAQAFGLLGTVAALRGHGPLRARMPLRDSGAEGLVEPAPASKPPGGAPSVATATHAISPQPIKDEAIHAAPAWTPPGPGHIPAPKELKGYPELEMVKRKTPVQGGGGKRKRRKDAKGNIYEWDSQHGALEMYDKRGRHLGEFDHETRQMIKGAEPTRTTER